MEFKVKSLKQWKSHDGSGFELDLIVDGKKAAHVYNNGMGGGSDYNFVTPGIEKSVFDFVKTVPQREAFGTMLTVTLDWLVDDAINAANREKDLAKIRKQCLTETLFRNADQKADGSYSRWKVAFTPAIWAVCVSKWNAVEFLNETV